MGRMELIKGACPLDCQDTCAWVARVEDGRVTKVSGAREHPMTRGSLCAKVNDYPTRMYAPDRLLEPLRRTGPKGSGEFEPVSWDVAMDEIGSRFTSIIDEFGAEALLPHYFLGSMGVVQRRALHRLFHALGSSRFHGSVCGQAGNVLASEGHPIGFDPEDMARARMVIVWGANPLSTCHHNWHFIAEARRTHGARIVCIDPRATRTARAADEHLAVRPGTDWALAAGIARVLFHERLDDRAFADRVALDVDEFAAQVDPWPPERVAAVCGIEAGAVVRLAREFAGARPGLIRVGIGVQQSAVGEAFLRAVSSLALISGHWQHRGGGMFLEAYPDLDDGMAGRPDLLAGNPRSLDQARLGETLTRHDLSPPVKGLMVWNSNPAVVQPDTRRLRQGLAREDLFTVVLDHFLTDTARYADIVLPSTTQLEHFDILGAWGHHYVTVNEPAAAPLGQSKPHAEVMRLLADRLGLQHPALHETDEQIAASALPPDIDLESLRSAGWKKTFPARYSPPPPDRRVRLVGPTPTFPIGAARTGDGKLQLLTPKAHIFMNSTFANMPRQRRVMRGPTLEIHPEDATERGIRDGTSAVVSNDQGTLHVLARVTDQVRAGVVSLPGKWWSFPPETGAVGNTLTSSAWSPGGQPAYNDTWVHVLPDPALASQGNIPRTPDEP